MLDVVMALLVFLWFPVNEDCRDAGRRERFVSHGHRLRVPDQGFVARKHLRRAIVATFTIIEN
jgi:hypothetical protein